MGGACFLIPVKSIRVARGNRRRVRRRGQIDGSFFPAPAVGLHASRKKQGRFVFTLPAWILLYENDIFFSEVLFRYPQTRDQRGALNPPGTRSGTNVYSWTSVLWGEPCSSRGLQMNKTLLNHRVTSFLQNTEDIHSFIPNISGSLGSRSH